MEYTICMQRLHYHNNDPRYAEDSKFLVTINLMTIFNGIRMPKLH